MAIVFGTARGKATPSKNEYLRLPEGSFISRLKKESPPLIDNVV